ncbi:MAG: ABC transporter permease, partial [Dehalococcoidia bacterium]
IGYGYWQRRFNGAPDVIGKTLSLDKRTYTIVGVTPAAFSGLDPGRRVDVTWPIRQGPMTADPEAQWLHGVIARLRPGVDVTQAAAEADTVFESFLKDLGPSEELRTRRGAHIELTPAARGLDGLRSRFSSRWVAHMLVPGIVLLVACVNLGSLLLARGAARAREFAIRRAAGAAAGRLLRQLLTETLLLFLLGAAAGLLIAYLPIQALTGFFATGRRPILLDVQYDWRLAAFAAGVALITGLLTGLWPAVRALRTDPQAALKDSEARLTGSQQFAAAGRVLVASQVALSLVLLVAAVMFLKTIVSLRNVDLGFSGERVLTMSLNPELPDEEVAAVRERFWQRVLERVRKLPGVGAASLSVLTPLSGRDPGSVAVTGLRQSNDVDRGIRVNHVSEDYFRAFGIRVLAGRAFTPRDAERAPNVVVLNEAAAKAYFGGRSPIGETLQFGESGVCRVVGVVRDHKHTSVREPAPRFAFIPLWQPIDGYIPRATLAVASDQPPLLLARSVAHEVRAIHPSTLVSDVIGVDEQIDATLASERLLSTLAALFAALALGLAAIGLYGVLSYSVARRKAELGIRMALGAAPARIAWSVLRDVLLQVAAGMAIGLPVAVAGARGRGVAVWRHASGSKQLPARRRAAGGGRVPGGLAAGAARLLDRPCRGLAPRLTAALKRRRASFSISPTSPHVARGCRACE